MLTQMRRMLVLTLSSLAVAVLVTLGVAQGAAQAQTPPFEGELPSAGGPALLVTSADVAVGDLAAALSDGGCDARLIAVTEDGAWLLYVPGALDVANEDFPTTLAANTPFAAMCSAEPTADDAVAVIEQYIADIDGKRFDEAYAAWEPGANPLTYEQFVAGYEHTTEASVDVGTPGPIDAGAGQRYIEIPVMIHAMLDDGTQQTFEGSFTLHRVAEIPGSTPEQRMWHIQSADLVQTS